VKAALARRGVSPATMDEIIASDVEHRELLQEASAPCGVKFLSRLVGEANRDKDTATAATLTEKSRGLGENERVATEAMERWAPSCVDELLTIPTSGPRASRTAWTKTTTSSYAAGGRAWTRAAIP